MQVRIVPLTLITYTYNDNNLALSLIDTVCGWNLKPSRIIVVDDGSNEKFEFDYKIDNIEYNIIRFQKNKGFYSAKSKGINSAKSKFVLSVDADIRIPDNWIEYTVPFAGKNDTGIVASPINNLFSKSYLSDYSNSFLSSNAFLTRNQRIFGGGVWLFQKKVWDHVGGMEGFKGDVGEDIYFCNKVENFGYKNYVVKDTEAFHIRKMNRITNAARVWMTQYNDIRKEIIAGENIDKAIFVCLQIFFNKLCSKKYKKEYLYFDVLSFFHAIISILENFNKQDVEHFISAIHYFFGEYKKTYELLIDDLHALGHDKIYTCSIIKENKINNIHMNLMHILFSRVDITWFRCLEDNILDEIIKQDMSLSIDFSSYMNSQPFDKISKKQ